jgi:hypothetical protein
MTPAYLRVNAMGIVAANDLCALLFGEVLTQATPSS